MRSGRGRDGKHVCVRERENGERLWVEEENAIYNGRGSGIDQSDFL